MSSFRRPYTTSFTALLSAEILNIKDNDISSTQTSKLGISLNLSGLSRFFLSNREAFFPHRITAETKAGISTI